MLSVNLEKELKNYISFMKIAGELKNSLTNGPGLRYVLFLQGCRHKCQGCHNKHTWSFSDGYNKTIDEIIKDIAEIEPIIDGITLSGGDPLEQATELLLLINAIKVKFPQLNILLYTGSKYDDLKPFNICRGNLCDDKWLVIEAIDILIDGRYEKDNPTNKKYRGSDNQRMLYLKNGEITKEE